MNKDDIVKLIDGDIFYHYKYCDFLYENLQEKDKEIERLNNIINTFEDDLENMKMNLRYSAVKWDNDCLIRAEVIQQVLHKLKELKESGKHE